MHTMNLDWVRILILSGIVEMAFFIIAIFSRNSLEKRGRGLSSFVRWIVRLLAIICIPLPVFILAILAFMKPKESKSLAIGYLSDFWQFTARD